MTYDFYLRSHPSSLIQSIKFFKKRAIYTSDSYSSNNVGDLVPAEGAQGIGMYAKYLFNLKTYYMDHMTIWTI